MPVGEGCVDVNDGESGVDQVDTANIGTRRQRVRRRLVQIKGQEGAEQFLGSFLTDGRQGNLRALGMQYARVVVSDEQRYPLVRAGYGRPHWARVDPRGGGGGSPSAHVPGVESHTQHR